MDALIRTIKLLFSNKKLYAQGLKRNIGDVSAKRRTLFDVFNRVLTL
jgi:hypothetical protein